jgi:hypothetical protein
MRLRWGEVVDLAEVFYHRLMRACIAGQISWRRFADEVKRRDAWCRSQCGDGARGAA